MSQELRVVPAALLESALKTLAGVAPGRFAVEAELRAIVDAPVPPAGGEVEVLAVVTLGSFSPEELGDIDVEPQIKTLERLQQQLVTSEDVSLELVDGAHVTRLQTEVAALQRKLTKASLSCHDLAHKLADKWGSVQGAQFETVKALRHLNEELQQRLNTADQRVDDLQTALQAAQTPFPGYPDRHPDEVVKS